MVKDIAVVLASDDNYAMPLAVTAGSILKNLSRDKYLKLFILDGGVSKKNKSKILSSLDLKRCSVTWFDTSGQFKEINIPESFTESIFHRLLIPKLLPEDINKVIYLDSDLLVLSDLSSLWNHNIDDHHVLAVRDFYCQKVSDTLGGLLAVYKYKELKIPDQHKYFNSGVLVINLEKWRKDNTADQVINYIISSKRKLIAPDQEGLNAILWDKWGELEPKWNYQVKFNLESKDYIPLDELFEEGFYQEAKANPCVKHFVTEQKPWKYYKHPEKHLFYEYLDLTAWSGWRYSLWKVLWRKIKRLIT
jgi:lipopolysaccharide biosynthesis glycosyltransferase